MPDQQAYVRSERHQFARLAYTSSQIMRQWAMINYAVSSRASGDAETLVRVHVTCMTQGIEAASIRGNC